MPTINKTAVVPYTQEQMYELVNDVESYSQFVPWCVASKVMNRSEDEVHGYLSFAKGGMEKSFSTINRLQPHKMIELRLQDGPFKQLEGFWRFEEIEEGGSRILFDLEYEFSNMLVGMLFGPVFQQISITLIDAFVDRAKTVYDN